MAKWAEKELDGISFENRKLVEVLKEKEARDKISEVEQERRREQNRGQRFTGIPWGRTVKTTYRGRSSKAKHWDAHKIRREYGLMKKSFNSQWENCLWLVAFEPPVDYKQVAKIVKGSVGGVTGALSYMWTFIGENNNYGPAFIRRFLLEPNGCHQYEPIEELKTEEDRSAWFDKAHAAFSAARQKYNKRRTDEKKQAKLAEQAEQTEQTDQSAQTDAEEQTADTSTDNAATDKTSESLPTLDEALDEAKAELHAANAQNEKDHTTARQLEDAIGQFVIDKLSEIGALKQAELKLTVSGGIKIQVNFGFGKN